MGKAVEFIKKDGADEKAVPSGTDGRQFPKNMPVQNRKTLSASCSVVKPLFLAVILLIAVLFSAEFILRIPNVRARLPVPVLGTGNLNFDVTWEYFQRTLNRYGRIDCIFMGSSMIKHAVKPALFEKRFGKISGQNLVCFNFGISGMQPLDTGFYKSLLEKFHPSLIVCEANPLLFYKKFIENRKSPLISQSPWGRFQSGKFSFKGWLLTHSLLFRYFMRWNMWARSPVQYSRLQRVAKNIDSDGFIVKGHGPIQGREQQVTRKRIQSVLSGPLIKTRNMQNYLNVFSGNPTVVFLEMPLKKRGGTLSGMKNGKFSRVRVLLRKTIERNGRILFSPADEIYLDKKCWLGINHLSPRGADRFTPEFADMLAAAVSTGKLKCFREDK